MPRLNAPTPPNHLPWLDWCRFLAAFAVVMVHARAHGFSSFGSLVPEHKNLASAGFYMITRIGTQAVLVFFVLSGFLVGGKVIERYVQGTFRPLDYAIDRGARILVPFLPILLLTIAIAEITGMAHPEPLLIIGNLFFLQGILSEPYPSNDPLWSISYEVWFYILAGVGCLSRVGSYQTMRFAVLMLCLAIFTILKPVYLFCWILGALAWIGRPGQLSPAGLVTGGIMTLTGMTGIQFFSEAQTASINQALSTYSSVFISLEASQLTFCAGIALIIQQLILMPPTRRHLVRLESIGSKMAAFSYTLYLAHNPVLAMMANFGWTRHNRFGATSIGMYLLALATCLAVSWMLYFMFERHTSRVKDIVKRKLAHSRSLTL